MLFRLYLLHPFAFLGKKVDIKERTSHMSERFFPCSLAQQFVAEEPR